MAALKVIVSALIILAVNWLAKKNPALAGWVAALPVISLLSAVWLAADERSRAEIADFLQGVAWGLIPTGLMLTVIVIALRSGFNLFFSFLFGVGVWFVYTWCLKSGHFFG
ncbi:DUF3147 family protein [Effusibacillus pohliae]|uniref:DUF3147 family protein n=1 Tax=Effusibacillus pohliae TaxID=232270 RepID=UPI00035F7907|nr:DUF3147 family protein [Effusibacillus pohliae]